MISSIIHTCHLIKIKKFIIFIGACFLLAACNSCDKNRAAAMNVNKGKSNNSINKKTLLIISRAATLLQDAALVTRSDNDFESLALQNFSKREQSYSHSGLAFKENGQFVIYHCMAGHENPDGFMRKDVFDSFVNPAAKTGFGIFQYQLSAKETEALHSLIKKNYADKIPFDLTFNLKSDDSLYCSEMIYKDLKAATCGRVTLPVSSINNFKPKILGYKYDSLFFKKFEYIGIDDLYLNPFCKEVIRVKY